MGYFGIRTTGSTYGYRIERRAFSNRRRKRTDITEPGKDSQSTLPNSIPRSTRRLAERISVDVRDGRVKPWRHGMATSAPGGARTTRAIVVIPCVAHG